MRPAFLTPLMHSGPRAGPSGGVGAGAGSYLALNVINQWQPQPSWS